MSEEVEDNNEAVVENIKKNFYDQTDEGQMYRTVELNVYEIEALGKVLNMYISSSQEVLQNFVNDSGYSSVEEIPESEYPEGMIKTMTTLAGASTASYKLKQAHDAVAEELHNQENTNDKE